MTFQTIRHAQQQIWPRVRESLDLRKAQREAVRTSPNPTVAASARARIPWNRVVADEAVWAIAKEGLLASPEQQAIVKAAQEWAKVGPVSSDYDDDDPEDIVLYDAVQALASSLTGLTDVEVLTDDQLSRSVSPIERASSSH